MLMSDRALSRARGKEGTKLSIHNSKQFGLLAVALMLVLVGASCKGGVNTRGSGSGSDRPTATPSSPATSAFPSSTPTAASNSPSPTPGTPTPMSSDLPTRWSVYRDADLGIAIPYPEGWYTRVEQRDGVLRFDADDNTLPPSEVPSDASPALSITVGRFDVEAVIPTYGPNAHRSEVVIEGQSVSRIDYETELGADFGETNRYSVYLWSANDRAFLVEGEASSAVLTDLVRSLTRGGGR